MSDFGILDFPRPCDCQQEDCVHCDVNVTMFTFIKEAWETNWNKLSEEDKHLNVVNFWKSLPKKNKTFIMDNFKNLESHELIRNSLSEENKEFLIDNFNFIKDDDDKFVFYQNKEIPIRSITTYQIYDCVSYKKQIENENDFVTYWTQDHETFREVFEEPCCISANGMTDKLLTYWTVDKIAGDSDFLKKYKEYVEQTIEQKQNEEKRARKRKEEKALEKARREEEAQRKEEAKRKKEEEARKKKEEKALKKKEKALEDARKQQQALEEAQIKKEIFIQKQRENALKANMEKQKKEKEEKARKEAKKKELDEFLEEYVTETKKESTNDSVVIVQTNKKQKNKKRKRKQKKLAKKEEKEEEKAREEAAVKNTVLPSTTSATQLDQNIMNYIVAPLWNSKYGPVDVFQNNNNKILMNAVVKTEGNQITGEEIFQPVQYPAVLRLPAMPQSSPGEWTIINGFETSPNNETIVKVENMFQNYIKEMPQIVKNNIIIKDKMFMFDNPRKRENTRIIFASYIEPGGFTRERTRLEELYHELYGKYPVVRIVDQSKEEWIQYDIDRAETKIEQFSQHTTDDNDMINDSFFGKNKWIMSLNDNPEDIFDVSYVSSCMYYLLKLNQGYDDDDDAIQYFEILL